MPLVVFEYRHGHGRGLGHDAFQLQHLCVTPFFWYFSLAFERHHGNDRRKRGYLPIFFQSFDLKTS